MSTAALMGLAVLAQAQDPEDFGLKAGPAAFFMFLALAGALVFLLRSMRKQMRRVDFDELGESDAERMSGAHEPGDRGR